MKSVKSCKIRIKNAFVVIQLCLYYIRFVLSKCCFFAIHRICSSPLMYKGTWRTSMSSVVKRFLLFAQKRWRVSASNFTRQTSFPNDMWRMSLSHDQSALGSCHVGLTVSTLCAQTVCIFFSLLFFFQVSVLNIFYFIWHTSFLSCTFRPETII